MFTKHTQILAALSLAVGAVLTASAARADITYTGSVNPADPTTWTSSTYGYVGYNADGTIAVTNGSDLLSSGSSIGYAAGYSGSVSVDGIGSTWNNTGVMFVGFKGSGVLNISNAGAVTCSGATIVAATSTASGVINFGPNGGTLTTATIETAPTQLTGTGVINTSGIVSDIDLKFDSSQSLTQTLALGNVKLNLNQTSAGSLGVGYLGSANLNITNGMKVNSASGKIGFWDGSWGTATVDGMGSAWNMTGTLAINHGSLNLINGGSVTTGSIKLGTEGSIHFDAQGETITTGNLYFKSPAQFTGTGTLNVTGISGDQDVHFDATHGLNQTFHYGSVNVNLHMGTISSQIIGMDSVGSLTIADGAKVTSSSATIGQNGGSTGTVNVTGAGSTWSPSVLFFGESGGSGILNITNGGVVNAQNMCLVFSSTSRINIDGNGSILNSSMPLATYGGILNVTNGGVVNSNRAQFGIATTQDGSTVRIHGNGSMISNSGDLHVGDSGIGVVNIYHGGVLKNITGNLGTANTYIGADYQIAGYPSSFGIINIDGVGSQWINFGALIYEGGNTGRGIVNITNGASVACKSYYVSYYIYKNSLLSIDAGVGSLLDISSTGSGTISNSGTIRVLAGANAALGTFVPIRVKTWSGTGALQALGGVWDSTGHAITINAAALGTAGLATNIDLSVTQRLLMTDSVTGKKVGAGFAATTESTNLNFMATLASADELGLLQSVVGEDQSILSGWDFVASGGYTAGDPAYLSLGLGTNDAELSADKLTVWHFDGTSWTKYATPDLSYDGTYASFTVTGFSSYAVTATVPEPTTALLLGIGMLTLLKRPRQK